MCRHTLFALAVVIVSALLSAIAPARPDTSPKIGFDSGQPVDSSGQIKATGTYSPGSDAALTIVSVTIECWPVQGGKKTSDKCKWKDGKWTGTISGVPAGKYNCHALMVIKDAQGKQRTWATPFAIVTLTRPIARLDHAHEPLRVVANRP